MTTIYLIRHGESTGNIDGTFTGSLDCPLSKTGHRQAELLCEYLKGFDITAIYSSDLSRAFETVLPLAEAKGLKITKEKNLREIFGGEWEGQKYKELPRKYPELFSNWQNNLENASCPGGESVKDVAARVFSAVKSAAEKNDGGAIAIAAHATPVRAFMAKCAGVAIDDFGWVPNASVTKITYENGVFKIEEAGITSYLKGLVTELADI